jgi:hypothetical protein
VTDTATIDVVMSGLRNEIAALLAALNQALSLIESLLADESRPVR